MFGSSPVGHGLQMLHRLNFWILRAFFTCKDGFISIHVLCVTCWPLAMNVSHTPIHCMHPFVHKQDIVVSVCSYPLKHYLCWVFCDIALYLMCASLGLKSWMTPEFHSYLGLELSYMFRKVPTSLWSLDVVQTFSTLFI